MSTLTVVRHAQARPFEKLSDCLSELGERQARTLGDYWRANLLQFDDVICGSLERHRRTAALAIGRQPVIAPEFNEYDAEGILRGYPPPSAHTDNRAFQKTFEIAMQKWIDGLQPEGETFATFHARVLQGLRKVQAGESNRRVLLFTSGGPIGVLVQTALGAPPNRFADVNWRVRNCSISEFVFSRDRLSLDSFNSVEHLPADLRTFR